MCEIIGQEDAHIVLTSILVSLLKLFSILYFINYNPSFH